MKKQREELRTTLLVILGCIIFGLIIGRCIATWADTLPPSPQELRGEIPMGPVKGK